MLNPTPSTAVSDSTSQKNSYYLPLLAGAVSLASSWFLLFSKRNKKKTQAESKSADEFEKNIDINSGVVIRNEDNSRWEFKRGSEEILFEYLGYKFYEYFDVAVPRAELHCDKQGNLYLFTQCLEPQSNYQSLDVNAALFFEPNANLGGILAISQLIGDADVFGRAVGNFNGATSDKLLVTDKNQIIKVNPCLAFYDYYNRECLSVAEGIRLSINKFCKFENLPENIQTSFKQTLTNIVNKFKSSEIDKFLDEIMAELNTKFYSEELETRGFSRETLMTYLNKRIHELEITYLEKQSENDQLVSRPRSLTI
jgi:hypothetical protein